MDSKEFGKKPVEEQIKIISKRLDEMRKNKTTVRDFPTDELNFSYPSQKLKKYGYWLDQTEYVLKRYAREGEMVIKKSDYEKLKSGKVITPDNSESEKMVAKLQKENDALKKQMEILKMHDSEEKIIEPYLGDQTSTYYVKIPISIIPVWNEFISKKIGGKQHTFEMALLKYIQKNKDNVIFDIKTLNTLSDNKMDYHTISISISKNVLAEWKEFCKTVKFTSMNILTTVALMEEMNLKIEDIN